MTAAKRTVFIVSDGTGITAEALANSLLTQFEGFEFAQTVIPFVDSIEKANDCVDRIRAAARRDDERPVVFCTLIDPQVRSLVHMAPALVLDFFEAFVTPLEAELNARSTHAVGRAHSKTETSDYQRRIEAINYTLAHDDGLSNKDLESAEVILVGVSRSGKTPTCLYMAMQFGIKAANYPLIPEDFERRALPTALEPHLEKLYGLTIAPERLARIRAERRPNSKYASIENCRHEVQQAEHLMQRHGIRCLNSTARSIEEIAATILQDVKVARHSY
jgi:regulator of PEP synthase PpsR (kinase-PPPase family)